MEFKKTITSIFMVPTLKIPKNALKDNGFINAYIKDCQSDVIYENAVYLLFKPSNIFKFREFIDGEYARTSQIFDDYDYDDGFVVVVYDLDEDFKSDFKLIKQGKYSKTSPAFQALFPKVLKIMKDGLHKDEISLQYRIFNKTRDLIDFWELEFDLPLEENQELWGNFYEENESLNSDKIKENVE